jgi:DNA polymerase elongation subunit (family B)
MSYLHTRGQQIKVLAQIYRDVIHTGYFIPYKDKNNAIIDPYLGALVQDPTPGNYDDVPIFDFESLYPCMIILMNICYTTLLREGDPTPDSECNLVRRNEHRGCPHDHSGKKIKKDKVLCCDITYRFRKVKFLPDGTRIGEGVMPKLERNLMVERKAVKKEMAKYEAMVKSAEGKATDDDVAFYAKMGWYVTAPSGEKGILPAPGSLTPDELFIIKTMVKVLNAKQLALKVSANSAYGALGAQKGFLPFVPGASSVTAMGRLLITEAINYIRRSYPGINANGFTDWMMARLVYGDTDSCLIKFMHIFGREAFLHGLAVAAQTTHYLRMWSMELPEGYEVGSGVHRARLDKYGKTKLSPDDVMVGARSKAAMELLSDEEKVLCHRYDYNPINLQFENLYSRLIMLSKKRYMTHTTNSKGEMSGKSKKGTVTARRDGSQFLRDIYNEFSEGVLKKDPETEVMYRLYDRVLALFTRQVQMANFVVVKGIKSVISYANKTPQGAYLARDGTTTFHTDNPLDSRLVYKNLPHLNLALKIMKRGDEVLPNTRMEYVYIENLSAKTSSDQTEDYDYYRENKAAEGFRIDNFFYLSSIENPMQELINVSYARPNILYESLEAALDRATSEADSTAIRECLGMHVKVWSAVAPPTVEKVVVGWAALGLKRPIPPPPARVYVTRRLAVLKNNAILRSMRLSTVDPDDRRYLSPEDHPELKTLALRAKSRDVMVRLKKQYRLGHIYEYRPQNRGEVIKLVTKEQRVKMMLTREVVHSKTKYPRETIVEMVASYRDGIDASTIDLKAETKARSKVNHIWSYDVRLPERGGEEGAVIHVERTDLAPFYVKDSRVIEQMHQAHKLKRRVNDDLLEVFSE